MEKRNMMKSYLGDSYSSNHLKNFCLYWMKGRKPNRSGRILKKVKSDMIDEEYEDAWEEFD